MSREAVNFPDFLPSKPLHPSPEHVSGHKIALSQAFVHEDLCFKLGRRVTPSRRQRLPHAVVSYQCEFLALQPIQMSHERVKDIAG
jgi:hypothetical protein